LAANNIGEALSLTSIWALASDAPTFQTKYKILLYKKTKSEDSVVVRRDSFHARNPEEQ